MPSLRRGVRLAPAPAIFTMERVIPTMGRDLGAHSYSQKAI